MRRDADPVAAMTQSLWSMMQGGMCRGRRLECMEGKCELCSAGMRKLEQQIPPHLFDATGAGAKTRPVTLFLKETTPGSHDGRHVWKTYAPVRLCTCACACECSAALMATMLSSLVKAIDKCC